MYGQRSHLVIAEYWRWWVVHLWVEGFFEVFATVVIAFLFTRLGCWPIETATTGGAVLDGDLSLGRHHRHVPSPLLHRHADLGAGAGRSLQRAGGRAAGADRLRGLGEHPADAQLASSALGGAYKWPIYFFVAVAFWNFVGAGLFGFMINPPIALYYMQGLNTTPVHGHTALFGVYGMLGLGLMLFCLRALKPGTTWKETPLAIAFWCINIGLAAMVLLSLLPVGLMQTWAAVEHGTWYARSAEFLNTPLMNTLRGCASPATRSLRSAHCSWDGSSLGLLTGHSYDRAGSLAEGGAQVKLLDPQEVAGD